MHSFAVSCFTASSPARLSKGMKIGPDGTIIKQTGGNLVEGRVETLAFTSIADFAAFLPTLTPRNALAHGLCPYPAARVVMQTQVEASSNAGMPVIARTREHFQFPAGTAVLMIDYDPRKDGSMPLTPKELRELLISVWPALAVAPHVVCNSASSHIYNNGTQVIGQRGLRIYVLVAEGTDIPRTGAALFNRLVLAGLGHIEISKSGQMLLRSIADAAVWQPERLDFVGGCHCAPPLRQERPDPQVFNAGASPVDTKTSMHDLCTSEKGKLQKLVEALKANARSETETIREAWIEAQTMRRATAENVDPEIDPARFEEIRETFKSATTRRCLFGDFVLHAENGQTVTVGEVLDDPNKWHGTRFADPACGSGGMFVQSGHFIEDVRHANPTERVTFFGAEKNQTTINLAKMNLAVHGLEGDIQRAITYYEDPHELLGKADFVMANPPFNVDEVDAETIKNDPRLPFGLPGVNKGKKVSNGNYLWISYFYSYLNEKGRAGFVMSSQASSAGRDEAEVRRKLIETGAVDVMMDIRGNFFYTRTVPCQLWFLDRAKPDDRRDTVLMIDARNVYRKVTRKIYDFSPEQIQNLSAIVWLYRGQADRFLALVADYLERVPDEGQAAAEPLADYLGAVRDLAEAMKPFLDTQAEDAPPVAPWRELQSDIGDFEQAIGAFAAEAASEEAFFDAGDKDNAGLHETAAHLEPLVESGRDLSRRAEALYKLAVRIVDVCEKELEAKKDALWPTREVGRLRKVADWARKDAVEQLRLVRYFHKQAHWLQERFPDAVLVDVAGLVKAVDRATIAANDWSLTPGRYVGVAPEPVDDEFDFEEALRGIHEELQGLNEEAAELAARIASNFVELGV